MTEAFRTGEQDEAKVVAAGVLHESKTRGRKKLTIAAMPKGSRLNEPRLDFNRSRDGQRLH
jgi:hypothetical protein